MNYTAGDQILGGKVAIISFDTATGIAVVEFRVLDDGFGQYPTLRYDPAGTVQPLETWAAAILAAAGK